LEVDEVVTRPENEIADDLWCGLSGCGGELADGDTRRL